MQNDQLKNVIKFYRPEHCIKCDRDSIEVFDYFNRPMNYAKACIARATGQHYEFKNPIYAMRCRCCGTKYNIRYDSDGFPLAYQDLRLIQPFMGSYKDLWEESERKMKKI